MKIEQLLVQHFYNNREVTLQGMGTFSLSPDFVMPKENDKDVEIPDHAISFQYNSRATADDKLIEFIVQQTRKMKALAAADLDSYLVLGKQFLNIGKPFVIEGMGILAINQLGELEFTRGHAFNSRLENTPAALKEKKEEQEISFASESKPDPGNRKILWLILILFGIGLTGTAIWYFFIHKTDTVTVIPETAILKDTAAKVSAMTDTASLVPATETVIKTSDTYTFKVVFMITSDSNRAVNRMNELINRGHHVIMYKKDSLRYKLAEPFKLPLSDTTRVKDSLNNFYFSGTGFIELD